MSHLGILHGRSSVRRIRSSIREAFKNYFSDARQFIELIEEGCTYLLPDHVLAVDFSNVEG